MSLYVYEIIRSFVCGSMRMIGHKSLNSGPGVNTIVCLRPDFTKELRKYILCVKKRLRGSSRGELSEVNLKETVQVGWVQRAHSIKGEIYVRLYNPRPDWLEGLKSLTLRSLSGVLSTYLVERVRPHKEGLIIECQEIYDRHMAETLKGYSMEIPRDHLVAEEGEIYLNEILNFEVVVRDRGVIGRIEGFTSNRAQDVLVVKGQKFNYEIPFVDEYITEIRSENSQIHLQLPEGLLELYEF